MKNINTILVVAGVALAIFLVPTAIVPSTLQEAQARIGHPKNCVLPPCPWEEFASGKESNAGISDIADRGSEVSFEYITGMNSLRGSDGPSGADSYGFIRELSGAGSFEYIAGQGQVSVDFVRFGEEKSGAGSFEPISGRIMPTTVEI